MVCDRSFVCSGVWFAFVIRLIFTFASFIRSAIAYACCASSTLPALCHMHPFFACACATSMQSAPSTDVCRWRMAVLRCCAASSILQVASRISAISMHTCICSSVPALGSYLMKCYKNTLVEWDIGVHMRSYCDCPCQENLGLGMHALQRARLCRMLLKYTGA